MSLSGEIGGLLGSMAGVVLDPISLMTFPIAAYLSYKKRYFAALAVFAALLALNLFSAHMRGIPMAQLYLIFAKAFLGWAFVICAIPAIYRQLFNK